MFFFAASCKATLQMLSINLFLKAGLPAMETQNARDTLPKESFKPVSL